MLLPKSFHNNYEESPDRLKELTEDVKSERGQQPSSRASPDALLKNHEWHLQLFSDGNLPIKNFILPLPYPPSRVSIGDESSLKVKIRNLLVEKREPKRFLILRTITSPYIHSSTVTIAEDEAGDAVRLTVYNLEDNIVDPILPKSTNLAIKQPCWSRLEGGGYHVRVDHPSDLVLIDSRDASLPESWRAIEKVDPTKDASQWKKEGDMMFLKKRFRSALKL
ncbi:hypothetical protein BDV95DRAFT_218944 [Massariosphaeria phaeospora]|uniref:Uncharacterized protein n=1 Tax=Massariosphaeria phaeospora TaxID=100035 RepID=A0A7C8MID5_9PLEO|nr:hypothetical protein BDV95DRAFT_218944 [Massariosphaeria phaeospora]